MIINENFIQDIIKQKLEKRKIGKVRCRLNLANTNFEGIWNEKYPNESPILQPEIDLVAKNNYSLNAIEVKYFKVEEGNKFNYSYYEGIDQAIAYLRFGFDFVALWHVFDDIPLSQFKEYGWRTWNFLRELTIPIDFTYFIFNNSDNSIKGVKTNDPRDETLLPDLSEGPPILAWRHPNPYLLTIEGKKIRSVINDIVGKLLEKEIGEE